MSIPYYCTCKYTIIHIPYILTTNKKCDVVGIPLLKAIFLAVSYHVLKVVLACLIFVKNSQSLDWSRIETSINLLFFICAERSCPIFMVSSSSDLSKRSNSRSDKTNEWPNESFLWCGYDSIGWNKTFVNIVCFANNLLYYYAYQDRHIKDATDWNMCFSRFTTIIHNAFLNNITMQVTPLHDVRSNRLLCGGVRLLYYPCQINLHGLLCGMGLIPFIFGHGNGFR